MLLVYFAILPNITKPISKRGRAWLNFFKEIIKLAWNLLSKTCANLINFLRDFLYSEEFLEQSRQKPTAFSRNRKLTFPALVLFLCNFLKSSYQPELNRFFKAVSQSPLAVNVISKAALCKARKKLKYQAFTLLNDKAVGHFSQNFEPRTWHGFFLKVIDGSTVKLPNCPDIVNHFGTCNTSAGEPYPLARISQLFDPLNQITHHALIGPQSVGEREMATRHFDYLTDRDLLLVDRGYPAFWFLKLILSRGAHFCARVTLKKWDVIDKFVQSGKLDQLVTLEIPTASKATCKDHQLDMLPMQLRLVRIELDTGETEVLVTSLLDSEKYPHALFAELYHDRWPVEEDYKVVKCRIEIGNFTGKSALSVYQDFHARIFAKNLTSMLSFVAQNTVEQKTDHRKRRYKVNITQALSTMKEAFILLFLKTGQGLQLFISELLAIFASASEPVRPGRKYPRNKKRTQCKYSFGYKPLC